MGCLRATIFPDKTSKPYTNKTQGIQGVLWRNSLQYTTQGDPVPASLILGSACCEPCNLASSLCFLKVSGLPL